MFEPETQGIEELHLLCHLSRVGLQDLDNNTKVQKYKKIKNTKVQKEEEKKYLCKAGSDLQDVDKPLR